MQKFQLDQHSYRNIQVAIGDAYHIYEQDLIAAASSVDLYQLRDIIAAIEQLSLLENAGNTSYIKRLLLKLDKRLNHLAP